MLHVNDFGVKKNNIQNILSRTSTWIEELNITLQWKHCV